MEVRHVVEVAVAVKYSLVINIRLCRMGHRQYGSAQHDALLHNEPSCCGATISHGPLPEAINDSSCSAEMLCRSSSLRFLLRFMETRNITQTSEDESLICGFGLFQASEEPSRIRPE